MGCLGEEREKFDLATRPKRRVSAASRTVELNEHPNSVPSSPLSSESWREDTFVPYDSTSRTTAFGCCCEPRTNPTRAGRQRRAEGLLQRGHRGGCSGLGALGASFQGATHQN